MNDVYYTTESASILITIIYLFIIVVSMIFALAVYLMDAIPLYSLAKKHGRPMPWLAFIPFIGYYCRTYVLADILDKKPLRLVGDNIVMKDRFVSFWISVAAGFLVPPLHYFFRYAYLRDFLYLYEADREKARNKALIVTILDALLTGGIARSVILIGKIKAAPLAVVPEEAPIPEKAWVF